MNTGYRSRSALIGIALFALAFVAGAAAGVAGDRFFHRGMTVRTRFVQDMSGVLDQLGLTHAQRTQARAILDRSGPRSREVMLEVGARLRGISDSVDAELRSILTPEQRSKLDSLRRPATFVLRRKDPSGATSVDTVYPVPTRR
jgi:Spy/CpxP family protein refolding chaperone